MFDELSVLSVSEYGICVFIAITKGQYSSFYTIDKGHTGKPANQKVLAAVYTTDGSQSCQLILDADRVTGPF